MKMGSLLQLPYFPHSVTSLIGMLHAICVSSAHSWRYFIAEIASFVDSNSSEIRVITLFCVISSYVVIAFLCVILGHYNGISEVLRTVYV